MPYIAAHMYVWDLLQVWWHSGWPVQWRAHCGEDRIQADVNHRAQAEHCEPLGRVGGAAGARPS